MEKIDISILEKPLSILGPNPIISLPFDAGLKEAISLMVEKGIGSVCILKEDKMVGILTERDLLTQLSESSIKNESLTVADFMSTDLKFLTEDDSLMKVLKFIGKKKVRHIPIMNEDGDIKKILSVKDVLKYFKSLFPIAIESEGTATSKELVIKDATDESYSSEFIQSDEGYIFGNLFHNRLSKLLEKQAMTIDVNATLEDTLCAMQKLGTEILVVMEFETSILGVVTERDFLTKIFGKGILGKNKKVGDYMTKNPHCLLSRHKVASAINNMMTFNYRHLIIVDNDRVPIGIISLRDILKFVTRRILGNDPSKIYE